VNYCHLELRWALIDDEAFLKAEMEKFALCQKKAREMEKERHELGVKEKRVDIAPERAGNVRKLKEKK